MKITPVVGPIADAPQSVATQAQQSAREKAIAKFMGGSVEAAPAPAPSQRTPMTLAGHKVQDQVHITPEESVQTHTQEEPPVTQGQESVNNSTVDSQAAPETSDAAPQEATTTTKEAPSTEEPQLSSRFAQLARREKAALARANAIKAQETELKAREDALKARETEMTTKFVPKDRLKKETLRVLAEEGFTPEEITNMMLNQPNPAETQREIVIEELRNEIKALKDAQDATKQSLADNQRQSYENAVSQVRQEAKALVEADPAYEMIKLSDASEDVVNLIVKTFEQDKRLMTVEEAAKEVEEYLAEETLKLARSKKIQDRLKPAPATAPVSAAPAKPQAKTLTSQMNQSRPLNSRERAILAFKGELKN